jgi:hypothetical protein
MVDGTGVLTVAEEKDTTDPNQLVSVEDKASLHEEAQDVLSRIGDLSTQNEVLQVSTQILKIPIVRV